MAESEEAVQEASWEELLGANSNNNGSANKADGTTRERKPRGRAASKVAAVTKETIRDAIALANLGIILTDKRYALEEVELNALADAWYQIVKEYPSVTKYIVVGKRLGVWGNLLLVHYQIIAKRLPIATAKPKNNDTTGTARPASGNDRQRKDYTSGEIAVVV